tara:strand:- start:7433 stop:7822 length:390 start_codon:yes stop_codon:yes gene_type:complete
MKNIVLLTALVVSGFAVSACGIQQDPLTPEQVAIAAELEDAPPESILVFNQDKIGARWGYICQERFRGNLTVSTFYHDQTSQCGSYYSRIPGWSTEHWARVTIEVITPNDPEYEGKVEFLMREVMLEEQ